jgi:uncharacterized membrane protein YsdA (DUF1294 family)
VNGFIRRVGTFVLLLNLLILILLGVEFTQSVLSSVKLLYVTNMIFIYVFWLDKRRACQQRQRINEMVLFLLSFMAANLSMIAAQSFFNHKSQKWQFNMKLLLSLLCQTAILIILYYWLVVDLAGVSIDQ